MPVIPTVKTYGRSKNVNSNYLSKHTIFPSSKASTVFDALFAKNIEKRNTSSDKTKKIITRARRKHKIIEELPLPGPSQLSSDESVHFIANTTFDNLLKGPQYNNVKFCNTSAIQIDSSIETSKDSVDHSSGYNTRKKVRKDYAKLHSNNEHVKSKVNSKGKANKQKISEKKKISKSIKVVLKQIADESTTDTVPKNNISNSFDKSISHSLIIEKETKKRDENSMELSRIIAESNRKYREKYFNASVVCARKFTPIISTSSRILPKKSLTSESNCSQLFQHGFRHCMRAESTPKYMLSSTPIPSNKQHQIAENPDVSPITARSRSQVSCKSRLVCLMDNNSDCEIMPSFILPSKNSLTNASTKDTVNIISPSVSVKPEEASVKSPYNLRTNDDSRINYSSLLKYRPRVSYAKRRVKSASAIEGKSVTKSQRYSLVNDIKLSVQPVVVIERNLDLLGITGKVRLLCSFNSHNDIDVSDYKETDKHAVQNNENFIASESSPVVLLEKLSHSSTKQRVRTVTTRSHSLKHTRHSDNVNGTDVSKSLFNSTELKRSNSESNIHCDDKISTLEISGEKDVKMTNDSVINLVSDTSENVIENSQRESVKKPLYHITTRRKKVVSINPVNEVINARETTQNRFGISLQEWERFSQSNICIVKIDHIVNEDSFKTSLGSPRTTPHDNDVTTKEKSEINSTCTNKHTSPIQNDFILTRSRKSSKTDTDVTRKSNNTIIGKQSIFLKPGKKWFRSLSILRHTNIHNVNLPETCNKGRKWRDSVYEILENQEGNESAEKTSSNEHDISKTEYKLQPNVRPSERRRQTLKIVPLTNQASTSQYGLSILEKSTANNTGYVSTFTNESVLESFDKLSLTADVGDREETARQIVLKRCGQTAPILFDDCYSQRILKKCRKIGEGVYGEVFMYKSSDNKCHVMKIIPIEGEQVVNGEHQKKFEEIISEIIIASELSNLRTNPEFCTDGFNELLSVCCIQGKYPQHLLDLWNLYDEDRGSENDSPEIFTDDQLYIVLDLANGGQDLEAYRFNNAEQAYSLFVQVVCSLAVAESALQFEHRDMHWGNILISPTDEPTNTFRLNGREFEVATKGVKVSIIDFTLSRMTYNNCCIFNDLSLDPDLFTATGDYQFEIYRLMKKRNLDDWQRFEPYSNILWLDYTLDKMIHHLRYLRVNTKTHKTFMRRLTQLKKKVLTYNSATEFLNSDVLSHVFL